MTISKIKRLAQNKAFIGTSIVTIGVFIGSIFAYFLQFALGRLLTVSEFGVFNSLLSLAALFTIPVASITNALIKVVSGLKVKNRFDVVTSLFVSITRYTFLFGLVVFVLVTMFKIPISRFLNIEDTNLIVYFAGFLGVSFLSIAPNSYLQGLLRFKAFAFFSSLGGFFKLTLPLLFIYLGFRVPGVFFGLGLGVVFTVLVALLLLKKNFRDSSGESLKEYYKKVFRFGIASLLMGIGMTALNNVDVVLVKHFFSEFDAGIYSSIVTVGKILLFGTSIIGLVMFPQVSASYTNNENYIKKFLPFLALQLFVVVSGVIVFSFLPELIVNIMFGKAFSHSVKYIPRFSVFVGLYVLVNFLLMFLLAVEKTKIFVVLLLAVVVQYMLISLKHENLNDIINANIFVAVTVLVSILVYCLTLPKSMDFANLSDRP
jgi:O-antigen/teichoic acid export membrane protein